KKIIDSKNTIQQKDFFWESQHIKRYVNVAQQYDTDEIDTSIKKWKYVDDFSSLSSIINQMKTVNSYLEKILERKDQLDKLANDIGKGIAFCEGFKGVSSDEREKYKKWGSELKHLRAQLSTPQNKIHLIDQVEEIFAATHNNILSKFSEIRAKLPYHQSRVVELINKTNSLEKNAKDINGNLTVWADTLGQLNISQIKLNLTNVRTYLEGIKEDVDNWPVDSFNQMIQDKCKVIADALDEQNHASVLIITAVRDEKSKLIEGIESFERKVNEIFNDEDIRILDNIAANNKQQAFLRFRQLPTSLTDTKQRLSKILFNNITVSANIMTKRLSDSFKIDDWFEEFNAQENQLDDRISRMQALKDASPMFQETREMLAQQSSMETNYYVSLRDYTAGLIDYSEISNTIDVLETDIDIVKMCNFVVQMGNNTIPRLETLKASLVSITQGLTNLKSMEINTLSGAKDFNKERKQILSQITALQQEAVKVNRTSLEKSCRQSIAGAAETIKNLISNANQTDKLNNLTSSLWSFYPEHKGWNEWISFLELYHITASDKYVQLNFSDHLRLVKEQGDALTMAEIAANPTKAFYTGAGNSTNFGWPLYVSHQKDPTVILAFVPAKVPGDTKPFYMAIHEISNSQYKLFLEKTGAKPTVKLAGTNS
ncbi:MAG: hypothetical protein ACYSSI_13490, partial [Planctomycetota bacterium]